MESKTHSPFLPSFHRCLLSTYSVTDLLLGAENKADKNPCLHRAYSLIGERNSEPDKGEKHSRRLGTRAKEKK